MPVGVKTLGNMMSQITKDAGLSKNYTNHCLRATTVTLLDDAKQESRHIISVTDHKSTRSLRSYSRVSDAKKREMSGILHFGLEGNDTTEFSGIQKQKRMKSQLVSPELSTVSETSGPPSVPPSDDLLLLEDDEMDKILCSLDTNTMNNNTTTLSQSKQPANPVYNFNNCTVNINSKL
jgi:hypothetical protein